MDELEKLFNVLSRDGYYTKSFEEFQTQYNDPAYRDKVFNVVTRDRLFTNTREEFDAQYAPSGVEAVEVDVQEEVPVKKKEDTVSPSEDGSSGFAEIFKGPREFLKTVTEKEIQEAPKGIPQQFLPSDGESQMPPSVTEVIERKADIGDKTIEFETYNPAVASKSATADLTQYKDYLPAGVKEIPNAKQVLEGDYNAVVPFDQAAYEKNPEAYQIIYNNKVKDYEEYLKGKGEYIKGYDGKYYSSDKFSPETILRKELATLQSRDGNLMDLGEEAIVDRMSERLGKFGFDVKYDPSVIDIPSGRIGSAITLTSQHTGNKVEINTDKINFIDLMRGDADREDAKEIDKLNAFVLKNFDEDKVEVKDLLKGLSAQDKAAMGAEAERKYETLSVGRTISDAEDMVSGIDKQIEAANKMLKDAQAMPDYEKAVSTSVGSGMMMGTQLRGVNKKKALKLKQAKAQLEYLKQQKKDADALLKSAEEGKQAKATKFASKVLGEQMMTESERLENEAKELSYSSKVIGAVKSRLEATAEKVNRATTQEEINDIAAQNEDDVKTYNELARIRKEQINNYNLDKENLRKDVGRKVILDAQVGGVTGSVVRSLASGVGGVLEGGVETFFGDLYANINNMFYDENEEGYLTDSERKKIKEDSIQDDIVGYVSDKFGITDEAMEAYRKGLSLQDMIKNVKEGKEALEGSNWFTEGVYGMIESLPAISTSLIAPGASIASFAAMGINGLNKEMESNPMFANVSENEKLLLTLPYGVVIGVLENYGFRNALNNSSLVSKLMFKALKKSKTATNRNFRELVVDEVENKILKGGILLGSSALSEFETGAAQQAVEGYMKEGYDVAKGMDYFKQSIDFLDGKYITKEFVNEVFKAGLSEMVGGFAMGAIPAISQARKKNTIAEIPIGAFMAYEMAMLDPAIRRAQTMRITEQVELGLKTKEEAAKEVQDYDITIGQLRAIPQEFDLKSRQQILALESQKKILEDKIEGKSVFTTREEQRQIKVLEERIEEVSANAQKGEAKKSNQDILTEEFVKSATKEEVTTEEAPVAKEVDEEVTQEQLAEVRALEEDAPAAETKVEEGVTTEEAPITEQASAFQKETDTEGKVPEVTQEQQDRYNNNEMSEQEIKDVLVGLNTKVQMRAEGKTEEKVTAFEKKIKKQNENLYREVVGMGVSPKTETVVEEEVTAEEAPLVNPKVVISGTADGYQTLSSSNTTEEESKSIKDPRGDKTFGKDGFRITKRKDGSSEVSYKSKVKVVDKGTRPGYAMATVIIPEGSPVNKQQIQEAFDNKLSEIIEGNRATKKGSKLSNLTAKQNQQLADAVVEAVSQEQISPKTETKVETPKKKAPKKAPKKEVKVETPKKEAPKKEAPKKETGVDAKLRAIAVKMDKAAKEKVSSKLTKAEKELIKKNPKRFKEINDEVKMPTTTADGIRSAIKMVEDSFKEKESKLKEQIKTIDDRVTDRMTKDKERQKKKDELSKARKEKNAKVKELKGKLTDMGAKFRLSDDVAAESPEGFITEDDIVEGMKKLGPVEKGFKIPSGIKEGDVDPIAQSKSTKKITDAQAKKLGFESVSDMLKNIQEFNGIPMIVAMSDVLASGIVKDSMGKKMKVDGGLLYNILGSNTELAWAGVNETGAEVQFREAQQMYRANKELFDRLWKEGKLPQNHVPMVVLRMGNSAINSNEAMFRYLAPLIKTFPKQNQDEAFTVLMESIEGKKNVSQKNKSGRDTVKSAEQLEEIINKNNITDVGSLFDFIVKDAKKRAKGDNENTIPLPARALLFDLVVSPVGVKKPSKGVAKALIKDTQSEGKEFLADKILSDIGETSMMESESGDAVAIMGVDVINGGVRKANHNNYGFGPKGRLIALIKNPMNGLNIFPEWRAKAVRVFKKDAKGEMPTLEKVLRQVGGAFFIDKAFRGARVQTEQSDIDVISGKMRFAFPGVSVSQTQQEFDEALKQEGIRTAESNGNTILGLTKDGKIFLNPSRKSLSTPIHEFGHIWIDFLRSESSKTKGTKLLKKGLELVEGTKALESAIKKYGDNELAREEALVELMGTKGETIANAAKRAKFIEWFNAFFKYIKEKLTRFKDVKVKDIKDISLEDFVDIGLAELFSGQAVDKESDVKFKPEEAATSAKARMQIIGENAQLSQQVRENLSVAKEMQALGTNSKLQIFLSTGWQQGKDSMWRYEIPDGEINKEEISDLYLGTFNNVMGSQTVKITDILEAPELYKAYPSLKNIPVVFTEDKYMDGADGSYSPGGFNMIRLNENLLRNEDLSMADIFKLKSILLHEVQHAIQHEEGFATGGNLGTGRRLLNTRFADQTRYKKHLRDIIKKLRRLNTIEVRKIEDVLAQNPDIEVYEFEKIAEQLITNAKASKKYIKPRAIKIKKLLEELNDMNIEVGSNMSEDIDNTIDSIYKEINNIKSPSSAYEAYKRIAGEVEARNVQARMNLSEEERREISLEGTEDVAREQQILLFNTGPATKPMASMKEKGVDLKGAIEKVIARARAKEISDNVIIEYLIQDKGFDRKKALATIKRVNRKNLRSAIKSLFASVKDITNISEQEAELVKELLKYDRATTRADKAIQKKAKQELLAQVRVMARVSKGKISAAQLSAVISRLTRVNLSRQSSIDGFVDYMRKVFSDADYAQKLTGLKSKIKQAKKNIRTKVGIGQDGLTYELENLLNIDPSIIPDDVFTKYEKLVTSFGEKKTVLSLPEATQVKQDIADINDALNTQNSLVGELTERFNSFEDKKTTEDGKVEYAATVKRMLKDKVITEEEAKLMTKFSKEINPREEKEGKSEEQKQKEMEEEKKELIQEVKDSEIDTSGITNRLAKQVAESLSEMIKTEAINELSNPQLKNLIKAIDNINSGYVNHYSQLAWENLMSTNFAKTATEAVKKAKPLPLSRAFAKLKSKFTGRTDIYTMIERTPLFYMDTVLGDFASKDIFNSILKDPAAALAAYQSASKQLYEKLDAVENSLMRAYKRNGNKIIESKYKQMAYMIQLEHESNPESKETKPASQIMEATIQSLYDSNQKRNAEVLEKILKEYSDKDGNIDLKKLKDSFKPVENKMIKAVQEVNSELTEKAVFTASIIRGEAIDPLNNYVHHQVLSSDGSTMDNVDKLSESVVNNTKPSTKAKNLIERVSKVSPINFDILSATKRGAKMTLIDYHLTSPLRVANKTLNKVQDSLPNKGEQREIFNGIRDGYNQAIKDVLSDNFSSNTFGADIDNFILKAGYRTMLVGGRFVSELLSNMLFAMKNPTIVKAGMAQRKVAFSAIGPKVVQNLKSPNQNRLYPEGLSGKLVDQELLSQAKGTGKAVQGKSKFVNIAAQVGSYATDNMTTRGLVALADKMISTPDMLATRTVWFGNFTTEFKKLTGQEVDFNKIAENDAEYMSKFKKELAQATKTADREAVLIGATDNPLMGILKNKKRAEDSGFIRLFKNFNGFMQKFLVFEFNAFRIGVQSAIGRGEISSIEGGKLLAAALIRMTSYVVVTPLVSDLVVSTIGGLIGVGDDDDEEEKKKRGSFEQQAARGVASSAVTLLSGSGGAGVKSILNFGTEYINKKYGAELGFRDKDIEYDPFLNSIAFNIVPEQKGYGSPNLAEDFVPRVAGAYAPFYNTANLSYKLLTAPELKEDDAKERRRREAQERLPLEVLGQLGLVPFYKEARKAVLKDIYKDLGKKEKSSEKSSRPKRPSRGKRKSRPKR